jgi:hypothetical protein
MNEAEIRQIRAGLEPRSTDDLIQIWAAQDTRAWRPEALDLVRTILLERGVANVDQYAGIIAELSGPLKQVYVYPVPLRGRYRGAGGVQISPEGVRVVGRSATLWAAIGRGLALALLIIAVFSAVFAPIMWLIRWNNPYMAQETAGEGAVRVMLFGAIYFGMRMAGGKKRDFVFPYATLRGYTVDPQKNLLCIDFNTHPKFTLVVIQDADWRKGLLMLRRYMPHLDASPHVQA